MEGGNINLGKRLEWRDREETCLGRISTSYRYVIGIIGTDLFTLEELGDVDLNKIKKN